MTTTKVQDESLVYSLAEVAVLLKLSRPSIYRAVKSGQIPCIRIGARVLVIKKSLDALLAGPIACPPEKGKGGAEK